MNRNSRKKEITIILLLLLITTIAVCVSVWALFFYEPKVALAPDYALQETEPNQQPIKNENDKKMETTAGGGAVSLRYSDKVTMDLSDKKVILNFANPGKSTQDMILQIMIQDQIIVQSGRITPGNKVDTLLLLDDAIKKLSSGGYEGKYIVYYYEPKTGEKSVVNTEIPITITVQE